ncbi:MAG: DUF1570 domain-containing protein [Planctomycetaceae bacterium]|nr:DUF1570 domain-containing protein [Planctomycetales bacterium]MCB9921095.1 DUF1570 domain-containing protein [Planctomycetaceae bacterium]
MHSADNSTGVTRILGSVVALLAFYNIPEASADLVLYRVPGLSSVVALQGTTTVNQGGSVTYKHPEFGTLYFDIKDAKIHRVPTTSAVFYRRMRIAEGDADKLMDTARWALRNGLLKQHYEAVDKALEANPQHPDALRVHDLKRRIETPLADSSQQEREMRALVGRPDMKIRTSKHFILMHDTSDKPTAHKKTSRSEQRLELLELVYESFMLRFFSHGVDLDIPEERLKVVLFSEHRDYLQFATQLNPTLQSASGFWDGHNNTSVFYDHATTDDFKVLQGISDQLQAMKESAKKLKRNERPAFKVGDRIIELKDLARMADTIDLLVGIERENLDIEVVSHEATHQMAGNTGLFPRDVVVPSWVHEGLATYFETPDDAAWSGIGAVNTDRLNLYRALERDRVHSNIDFIVGDQIFDTAATLMGTLHGYGQAWALTHFLMERHFKEFITFYRRIGEMPPDVLISPQVLTDLFSESFGTDRRSLDNEWRAYMRSLKTDLELILEEE